MESSFLGPFAPGIGMEGCNNDIQDSRIKFWIDRQLHKLFLYLVGHWAVQRGTNHVRWAGFTNF